MSWSSYGQGFEAGAQFVTDEKVRICHLSSDITQTVMVAIVIGKQDPRSVVSKKQPGTERFVLNFTLRDSPSDTLNATCWGEESMVRSISDNFMIGNIVKIKNAQIVQRQDEGNDDKFRPHASSCYQLNLSPLYSEVTVCDDQFTQYFCLLRCPLQTPSSSLTLADVVYNGQNIEGSFVSLLVCVREIGKLSEVRTKDGKKIKKMQLNVFDQTHPVFPILVWEEETANFLVKCCQKRSLLYIADIRVNFNNFLKEMVATATSCTIFTPDPEMEGGAALHEYAQTVSMPDDKVTEETDLSYIRLPVYTVQQVRKLMLSRQLPVFEDFEGMTFSFISNLDIDGHTKVTSLKCTQCKQVVNFPQTQCNNGNCDVGSRLIPSVPEPYFDIQVTVSDHSGTIDKCIFYGDNAEKLFNCKAEDFLKMTKTEKTGLKWKFLMERFKIIFKIPQAAGGKENRILHILSCEKMDQEDMKLFLNLS